MYKNKSYWIFLFFINSIQLGYSHEEFNKKIRIAICEDFIQKKEASNSPFRTVQGDPTKLYDDNFYINQILFPGYRIHTHHWMKKCGRGKDSDQKRTGYLNAVAENMAIFWRNKDNTDLPSDALPIITHPSIFLATGTWYEQATKTILYTKSDRVKYSPLYYDHCLTFYVLLQLMLEKGISFPQIPEYQAIFNHVFPPRNSLDMDKDFSNIHLGSNTSLILKLVFPYLDFQSINALTQTNKSIRRILNNDFGLWNSRLSKILGYGLKTNYFIQQANYQSIVLYFLRWPDQVIFNEVILKAFGQEEKGVDEEPQI